MVMKNKRKMRRVIIPSGGSYYLYTFSKSGDKDVRCGLKKMKRGEKGRNQKRKRKVKILSKIMLEIKSLSVGW